MLYNGPPPNICLTLFRFPAFQVPYGISKPATALISQNRLPMVFNGYAGVSKGLFWFSLKMAFKRETGMYEEYPEREVFQLSFCMNGICQWDYRQKQRRALPAFPNMQVCNAAHFQMCKAISVPSSLTGTLSISLEQERFPLTVRRFRSSAFNSADDKICTYVFSTTPEIRLVLQQLLDCPPERKLRKLYLEGKS